MTLNDDNAYSLLVSCKGKSYKVAPILNVECVYLFSTGIDVTLHPLVKSTQYSKHSLSLLLCKLSWSIANTTQGVPQEDHLLFERTNLKLGIIHRQANEPETG
jgi:hypothetical protein